jgi:hypothetical protein
MGPSTDDSSAWRRRRSRFYLGLLIGLMAAIAVAGWLNVRRLAP